MSARRNARDRGARAASVGARPPRFEDLAGVWRSRGYGTILEIDREGYTLHEETAVSCLPVYGGSLEALAEHFVDLEVSPGGSSFSARRAVAATRVSFRRLTEVPATVRSGEDLDPEDAEFAFEVFWHTFEENYAFFELKGIDWQAMYETHRPRIRRRTDPDELFDVLVEMTRPLRDAHVELHAGQRHFDASAATDLHARLSTELDLAGDDRDIPMYLADLREWLRDTIREEYVGAGLRHAASRTIEWGWLDGRVGYLNLRAMAGASGAIGRPAADLEAVDEAMALALDELGGAETLAVDLRLNGGGYDAVALRLASHLVDRKRVAFSKAARYGDGTTGRQPVTLEPTEGPRFAGQLALLTSNLTASAAEVFVLALLQHPRVVLVGEPTHGILSDAMERHLPNGWRVTLSNEVYYATDGELYEYVGVPPHVEVPFLEREGRERGCDPMLDLVLSGDLGD